MATQADIDFCNKRIRVAADKLAQAYNFAKIVNAEWNARGGATAIPNTSATISDGSPTDGRPGPLTGIMVNAIVTRLQEKITDYEATSSAKLNTILVVSVNPSQNIS